MNSWTQKTPEESGEFWYRPYGSNKPMEVSVTIVPDDGRKSFMEYDDRGETYCQDIRFLGGFWKKRLSWTMQTPEKAGYYAIIFLDDPELTVCRVHIGRHGNLEEDNPEMRVTLQFRPTTSQFITQYTHDHGNKTPFLSTLSKRVCWCGPLYDDLPKLPSDIEGYIRINSY